MARKVSRLLGRSTEPSVGHKATLIQHSIPLLALCRHRLVLSNILGFVSHVWSMQVARLCQVTLSTIQAETRCGSHIATKDWLEDPLVATVVLVGFGHNTRLEILTVHETKRRGMVLRIHLGKHRGASSDNTKVSFGLALHDAGRLVLLSHHLNRFLGTLQVELVVLLLVLACGSFRLPSRDSGLLPPHALRPLIQRSASSLGRGKGGCLATL